MLAYVLSVDKIVALTAESSSIPVPTIAAAAIAGLIGLGALAYYVPCLIGNIIEKRHLKRELKKIEKSVDEILKDENLLTKEEVNNKILKGTYKSLTRYLV